MDIENSIKEVGILRKIWDDVSTENREQFFIDVAVRYLMKFKYDEDMSKVKMSTKCFIKQVYDAKREQGVEYEFNETTDHRRYIVIAMLWARLLKLLNENDKEMSMWKEEEIKLLKNSGTLFHNIAYGDLKKVSDEFFLYILRMCVKDDRCKKKILNGREGIVVERFIKEKLKKSEINIRRRKHDELEEKAICFLKETKGCKSVACEVSVERKKQKSEAIDVVGVMENGHTIGIECKRTMKDFNTKEKKEKIKEYSEYCNELYVFTSVKEVYDNAVEWCKSDPGCGNIGCILWNEELEKVKDFEEPTAVRQEINNTIRTFAQEMVRKKSKKILDEIFFSENDSTPEQIWKKIKEELLHAGIATADYLII